MIPTLTGTLTGATLSLDNHANAGISGTFSVSSLGSSFGYSDIGAGTDYGSESAGNDKNPVVVTLNSSALTDIGNDAGGTF